MASSPLSIFRKYQYIFLVVFGVLLMVAFIVGPIVDDYFQSVNQAGAAGNQVVVTWTKGSLREGELAQMRAGNQWAALFTQEVARRAQAAGGSPKAQPIRAAQTDEELVQTLLLAERAEQMGMEISNEAITEYLDQLSDEEFVGTPSEYGRILQEVSGRALNNEQLYTREQQLFSQLRIELLARNMQMLAQSGLYATPPGEAWDYYNRLNRRISAELWPLEVKDFIAQVKDPSDEQVQQFYAKHKDQFSHPDLPDAGFKRRRQIAFEYLKADFDKFLEEAVAEVSDDEVQKYYEENKEDFRQAELPSASEADGKASQLDAQLRQFESLLPEDMEDEAGDAATPGSDTSPAEQKPAPAEQQPATDKPAKAEQENAEPAAANASDEEGGEKVDPPQGSAPAEEQEAESKADAPALEGPTQSDEGAAPETDAQSRSATMRARLVSFQETEQPEASEAAAAEPAQDAEPEAEPSDQAKPADEKPADEKPADEKPADDKPADDKPAGEPAAAESPAGEKPEYKPLEEVADEIRQQIARPKAQERMEAALKEARSVVSRYSRDFNTWKALHEGKEDGVAPPEQLDVKQLAERFGLEAGETPLVNALEVQDYELGRAYTLSFAGGQIRTISFPEIAYQQGVPLYKPDQIRSFELNQEYLYWKTDQKKAFVPELNEIRDEVVRTWKMQQAVTLAQQQAERLAEKVRQSDKPMAEVLGGDASKLITPPPFSWLTRGATPTGVGNPTLSEVPGVRAAGREFMENVFSLDEGQVGTALNQPHDVVYVVKVTGETPPEDERREQFLATGGMSSDIMSVAMQERAQVFRQWYDDLEQEMKVEWKRNEAEEGAE